MIMGLAVVPLILVLGIAIDSGLAYNAQNRLQAAVDSAVLAGARNMGADVTEMTVDARMFFDSNYPADYLGGRVVSFEPRFDSDKLELKIDAKVEMSTFSCILVACQP